MTNGWDTRENHLDVLDEQATSDAYAEKLEAALQAAFPGTEINVERVYGSTFGDNTSIDFGDGWEIKPISASGEQMAEFGWVDEICDRVYQACDWLVYQNDPISLAEAAEEWGLSRITVAQACREGRVAHQRVGRMYTTTHRAMAAAIQAGKLNPRQ